MTERSRGRSSRGRSVAEGENDGGEGEGERLVQNKSYPVAVSYLCVYFVCAAGEELRAGSPAWMLPVVLWPGKRIKIHPDTIR